MRLLQSFPRLHVVAWLLVAPALVGAVEIAAVEAGLVGGPASLRGDAAPTGTLAGAIADHDVKRAYAFVRAGQDPNTPVAFPGHVLAGDRPLMVSPLILAVASKDENTVRMLLSFGVRMELPGNRLAACLADRLAYKDIAKVIDHHVGRAAKVACPEPHRATVPMPVATEPGTIASGGATIDEVFDAVRPRADLSDPVSAQVFQLYREILLRDPNPAELASDTGNVKRLGIESLRQDLVRRAR